ncbi:Hypothetical protein CAP_2135 [Chondromyces apiculatus DSM 436]|uniref:Transglutaminase-like domain-containing protein n=1 Tax=Chondromyces apiculatus DSM 436 TaxID=1192034 RepID=A0A017TBF3_9BACT|nr:Hypothetical protein CAP_2135 [Chondromyces apiculatus DSM 436]
MGATPEEMVGHALNRARRGEDDALAGMLIAAALDERAAFGRAREGLAAIGASDAPLADEARWLARLLAPEPPQPVWAGARKVVFDAPADAGGLVKSWAVLGPFQDNSGGGLARREGPEAPGASFADAGARYSWGVYDVAWRRALPASATARGVPLDLYVHPRAESCSYLASRVTVPASLDRKPFLVHVGASGAVRLIWDGAEVASSEALHRGLVLDRLAAQIAAPAGEHLLALKVCTGSVADDGRVRARFTDTKRKPLALATSSDLSKLRLSVAGEQPPPLPAGVTRVRTALEAALDAGEAPTAEQMLLGAVARTLGAGDDQRSPRAPGLLDVVARAKEVSPDALALVGWISPFGANRSGWLEQARVRGLAEKDRAAASFAQRRLAAAHLGAQLTEWGMAALREDPLRSARDVEARLMRAIAKRQLGGGMSRAALDELVKIADELGDRAPVSVWTEIYDAARSLPDLRLRAAQRLAGVRAGARDATYVRTFASLDGASLEKAAAAVLAEQTSAEDVIQIGRALYQAGRYAWAREVFYWATQVAPNRPEAFQGLSEARNAARAMGLGGDPVDEGERATVALARARDLTPGDPTLKAQLAFRLGEVAADARGASAGRGQQHMPDEQFLAAPDVFLQRAKGNPAQKGEVFDRQLHWTRVVTYHPDKRVSQLMQYAREIVIEPRTEQDLYESGIPAEGEQTELLFARVHHKDGSVSQAAEQSAGGARPFIRWEKLEEGDVVEVAVRSWTGGPVGRRGDAPFYFLDYVGSTDTHPILYNEVVIDSPKASPLAVDVLNGKADRVLTSEKAGRTITRYIWDNPPEIPEEPFAPRMSEVLPVVVGSTFNGWNDFREWYRSAVTGFTEPDEQVRRLAEELTAGKKTPEDKIRALFNFVADDIRYVNFVSGEWWLPNRPQQLLARRQGDCDDKAMLLITLLKSIGIEATEVLVQTRHTAMPSVLRSEKAAIPVFDHGIAYLPGKDGKPGLWLDATSPQSRLGPLPSMDARTLALFVSEGPAKIVETPASSPADHGVEADWTIRVSPTGAGDLTAKERHLGDAAFELRNYLAEADARAQWVEQFLAAGWFPTVDVKSKVDFEGDLPNGLATLGYEAHSEGLGRLEGDELAVPIAGTMTLTSQLAPLPKRKLPVVLPPNVAPAHRTWTMTVVAPLGYRFAELPPGGEENGGEFGRASLSFTKGKGPNSVVVKRSFVADLSTIPVEKYGAWRAWLQRVDGLMHRMVRLTPERAAAGVAAGAAVTAPKKR